ncbi:PilD-dependent protein PddA [Limihaloglobus sulfuriphilus]|uniref:PilD-dependent protein PddA n=1 Tax=Limihaloglobus sulfuriphilus TaxID=1851148 RepID=A0A1Q2MCF1_9BACT|nr:type II secretion system protein [Limihaloglobus sulfuriphilus]AQQ70329.1 PilD-dependent protein PddA [Limihaloglobus sulfuriphilus]
MNGRASISRGFTLIELLVVISIIALLMSILMPALTRARDQAKTVICKARQKDIGLAINFYVNDHNGLLMASWPVGNEPKPGQLAHDSYYHWFARLAPYYNRKEGRTDTGYYDYELLRCPTQDKLTKIAKTQTNIENPGPDVEIIGYRGIYGYNLYFCQRKNFPDYQWKRLGDIQQPSTLPLIGDISGYGYSEIPSLRNSWGGMHMNPMFPHPSALKYGWNSGKPFPVRYNSAGPAPNHNGKINYLMADSHVESVGLFDWADPSDPYFAPDFWKPFFHPKRNPDIRP